jgi:hypothetical protein
MKTAGISSFLAALGNRLLWHCRYRKSDNNHTFPRGRSSNRMASRPLRQLRSRGQIGSAPSTREYQASGRPSCVLLCVGEDEDIAVTGEVLDVGAGAVSL